MEGACVNPGSKELSSLTEVQGGKDYPCSAFVSYLRVSIFTLCQCVSVPAVVGTACIKVMRMGEKKSLAHVQHRDEIVASIEAQV